MATLERICPNCGAANPSDRERCIRCGLNLLNLPARKTNNLPARVDDVGIAALVLGAGALIARAGLKRLARELLSRIAKRTSAKTLGPHSPSQTEQSPDYVVRGWRAWSIQRGAEHSSGSERFEWRVNKK